MGVKPDCWILEMCERHKMIDPFVTLKVHGGVISYGPSSYGYDLRLGSGFTVVRAGKEGIIDPKDPGSFNRINDYTSTRYLIHRHTTVLGHTMEYIIMPPGVNGTVYGKSTYSRCGLVVVAPPFEAGWEGVPTIAMSNLTGSPIWVYPGEGIIQLQFEEGDGECLEPYHGKYQGQTGITLPKI